ncbi:MAG: ion channel [Pseudomonadota bacterium]
MFGRLRDAYTQYEMAITQRPIMLVPLFFGYVIATWIITLVLGLLLVLFLWATSLDDVVSVEVAEIVAFFIFMCIGAVVASHYAFLSLKSLSYGLFSAPSDVRLAYAVEALASLCLMFAMVHYCVSALSGPDAYHGVSAPSFALLGAYYGNEINELPTWDTVFGFVYFSVVTFTTVGYGDIHPVSLVARLVSTIQMVIGFAIIVLVISRIGSKK